MYPLFSNICIVIDTINGPESNPVVVHVLTLTVGPPATQVCSRLVERRTKARISESRERPVACKESLLRTPLDEMDAGNCIEAFSSEEYILERSNDYSDIVVEYGVVDKLSVVPRNSKLDGRRRFLCCFLHRHLCFRLAEVQSVAEQIYGLSTGLDGLPIVVWEEPLHDLVASAFWYMHLPDQNEEAERMAVDLANGCLLVRCILDIWGEASTLVEVQKHVEEYDMNEKQKYASRDQSFRLHVEGFGLTLTQEQKLSIINSFGKSFGSFKGPINLNNPDNIFWVIVLRPEKNSSVPNKKPWYACGREIAVNQTRAPLLAKYDLRKRRYLGPTSMDAELSFLMCTMCQVKKSSFVVDPFVGTGGLLVPAAEKGAITLGIDIDIRVIKLGKKDKRDRPINVWTNFKDYGLPAPVGLLRADIDRNPFRDGLSDVFDAVLADPPYGVRAGGRKSRSVPGMKINSRSDHIASTEPYPLAECLRDLLEWASRVLIVGGRLGYWVPCLPHATTDELPDHPMLHLKYNCEQVLGGRYNRRLVVMEKTSNYDQGVVDQYFHENPPPEKLDIDDLWGVVYSPAELSTERKAPTFRSKFV